MSLIYINTNSSKKFPRYWISAMTPNYHWTGDCWDSKDKKLFAHENEVQKEYDKVLSEVEKDNKVYTGSVLVSVKDVQYSLKMLKTLLYNNLNVEIRGMKNFFGNKRDFLFFDLNFSDLKFVDTKAFQNIQMFEAPLMLNVISKQNIDTSRLSEYLTNFAKVEFKENVGSIAEEISVHMFWSKLQNS